MSAHFRLIVAGLMTGLAGCDSGQSTASIQTYLQVIQARPGAAIPPVPSVRPQRAFIYEAVALRSPFQVSSEGGTGGWQASLVDGGLEGERVRQVLEGVDLAQFEMVGTLFNAWEANALLRVNGAVHRLKVGDYLGRNNGQIASIEAAYVEVFEVVSDGRGGWLERSLTIPLKQHS